MRKYTNEFKVGLFVIFCIIGLFYMVYRTGKVNIKKDGYYIYVIFDEVAGLENKAPVMLNGLEVGKVDKIEPIYDGNKTKIKLTLWLDKNAKIRTSPTVSIKTLGLMGEKYIQISSHTGDDFILPNSVIEGKPYMDLDVIMEKAENLSNDVGNLITNVNSLTDEVKKVAINLGYTVKENEDEISRIIKNLESASKNIEEMTAELKTNPWKLLYKPKK
ncbi:MAG: MlaD family protein [Candidatus Omnitrophica bacterium]|nr:MlaD family protein [Candidatus Omnitrophota bacterium]MCM8830809.1 MlaD family protein [Candidatus Omnitrophota bacterium]